MSILAWSIIGILVFIIFVLICGIVVIGSAVGGLLEGLFKGRR